MSSRPEFIHALRGYDVREVDALVERAERAAASDDPVLRASVRHEIHRAAFTVALRGYDRSQVNGYLQTLAIQLG
ncbi:DivIVA domain-containing protein [Micromonospora sp. NPDC050397]|uniref:DivIVA domain-containing protein n=1 Tax=Micromonospora sp. NPDC050397 TaxID=3364279 RepID=UPI003850D53A